MYRFIFIILFCLLAIPLHAKDTKELLPTFRSTNGKKVIRAMPIKVEGKLITFRYADGTTFAAEINKFSPQDRVKLKKWVEAVNTDPQQKLVNRVKGAEHLRVLFVGNSYSFNIPKAFQKIAKSKEKKITVEQVTSGGCTLSKHSKSEKLLAKIKTGKYDVVILQEQSQLPSIHEGQRSKNMDEPAKLLVKQIKDSGAIPVFFQTWGRKNGDKANKASYPGDTFDAMQARLVNGYQNVAKACGGDIHIIPVGELWKKNIDKDKSIANELFSKDGSHPAKGGVNYSAAIFFSALYDEPMDEEKKQVSDAAQLRPPLYK